MSDPTQLVYKANHDTASTLSPMNNTKQTMIRARFRVSVRGARFRVRVRVNIRVRVRASVRTLIHNTKETMTGRQP